MARQNTYVQQSLQPPDMLGGRPSVQTSSPVRMTVLYHLTLIDLYVLTREDGPDDNTGFVLGCMNGVSSPWGQGASGGHYLAPGTHVLVLESAILGYADVGGRHSIHPILSVDNEIPASDTWYWPDWTTVPDGWLLDVQPLETAIEKYHGIPETDRLRGKPSDRTPGDWEVGNPLKGHLYIGGVHLGMEASPMASLHMYSDDSTVVFNKGFNFIEDLPWGRHGDTADVTGKSFEAEHRADTTAGALGFDDAAKAFSQTGLAPGQRVTVGEAAPKWDWLRYRGKTVGGEVSQRVLGRQGDSPQPGGFSFDGVDGVRIRGAANSMTFTRTPDLPYMERMTETGFPDSNEESDAQASLGGSLPADAGDYASQYADLMYELMKRKFVERYWAWQKKHPKDWKALSMAEVAEMMGRSIPSIRPLGADEPAYKGQDMEMKDPLSDNRLSLSKLESYIHLSDTGAIVISDGTGSEIRMEGGHITISPAADLRLQPGRDAVMTVPRSLSMFSRDRLELSSDRGEIVVHADKSLALSAEGVATLESRGPRPVSDASYDNRGNGGGVVIRSATDTHVLGANVRVALQKGSDRSSNGTEQVTSGMLILDGGGSPVAVQGGVLSLHAKDSASLSAGDSGKGLLLDPEAAYLFSTKLVLPINQSIFGGSGTMKWIDPQDRTMKSSYFPSPSSAVVAVRGNVEATKTVSAHTVAGNRGMFKRLKALSAKPKESLYINPAARSGYISIIENYMKWAETSSDPVVSFGDAVVSSWFTANASNPLMTADGTRRLGVYYPMASGYHQADGFWVASRWQRMLAGSGRKWTPKPVKDADDKDMLPFPGLDGWTERPFLRTWDEGLNPESSVLSGGWTINAG